LKAPATQVKALILGEHGDSMVPIWSSATVGGLPMEQWPTFNGQLQREAFDETRTAGAALIKLKGGSGFAVGLSIRELVHSILLDSRKVLPVGTLQQGLYGLRDVVLSVPTVVGCGGAREQIELPLSPKERMGLTNSARVLREIIDQVEARLGGGGAKPAAATPSVQSIPASTGSLVTTASNGKAIPRSAWQQNKK
jgi:L-lactate dehydrogenase